MIMWHSLLWCKPYLHRRLIIKTKVDLCTPLRHVGGEVIAQDIVTLVLNEDECHLHTPAVLP